jgi:regulatory protein
LTSDRSRRRSQTEPDPSGRDLGAPADLEAVARTIVLTKLASQARSRHELEEALDGRGVPQAVATAVLDRFEAVGLVDDAAFADAWIQSRQTTRGLSRQALRHELRRKGVDDGVIADCLESIDPVTEVETARRLVERKLHTTRHLSAETRFRRLTGLLARKGYPAGMTFRVVREALATEQRPTGDETPVVAGEDAATVLLDPC